MVSPLQPDVILHAEGLSLGYAGHRVLNDVSLVVRRGELWVFLGGNGQGKTSFLHAVLGLLPPLAGTLALHSDVARREHIGFVPQRCDLNPTLPTTVREFVSLGLVGMRLSTAERATRLSWALGHVGLESLIDQGYWALSGGQRQRALLARALIRRPQLLLLDEPTSGLDPASEDALLHLLTGWNRDEGRTILFVTHDVSVAERHATHVALFMEGRVIAGPRAAVLTRANLERIYGVVPHSERGFARQTVGGHH
jgi:ABC-type Mn2+/Zn2+ transport system ATPase subunit